MEEILQKTRKILLSVEESEKQFERDFEVFKEKINGLIYGIKEPNSTPQQKKKVKRLSIIVDDEDNEADPQVLLTRQTSATIIKTEVIETSVARPSRAAKLKVGSFKEPALVGKLRRPSNATDTLSETKIMLQQNGDETTHIPENQNTQVPDNSRISGEDVIKQNGNAQKRSLEDEDKNDNNNRNDSIESAKKVDESLLIVPNGEVAVVEISDSETEKLMPPPNEIPKKKTTRKVKQAEDPPEPQIRSSLRIKKEKLSAGRSMEKDKQDEPSDAETEKFKAIEEEIKQEKTDESTTAKRGKPKRGKKQIKCLPIKEESGSDDTEKVPKVEVTQTRQTRNKTKQGSIDSVYEDAVGEAPKTTNHIIEKPTAVLESADNPPSMNTRSSKDIPADATFVSAKDVPIPEADSTFITNACPQQTFIMDKTKGVDHINDANKTQTITNNASPVNATFSVNDETFQARPVEQTLSKADIMRSSIMTEEDSGDEFMPPPPAIPALSKMKKKELFNPVKKKVEAFEKHANAMASPAAARQTRLKAKLKENRDPEFPGSKQNTPLLQREIAKLLTPTQSSNVTPNLAIPMTKFLANSTSKLAQLQKSAKPASALSKTKSLSRENSAEDIKRGGYPKLQQIADEKKKKRELKQQQAAMTREAKEKERTEKLKKALQEREEKARRRKAQELEMKKQLEEINKNIKMQEEKREGQKRLEKKQLELELAEVARKEREAIDNMKIQKAKEELQQKLLENQRLQQEKKATKKVKDALKYDFDLLNSGDSTDEEGKPSSKRPPPPVWSKSSIRQMLIDRQSQVPTKIVDSFFSVQPMTPDLREIFPAIDPRNLKRNSSMYWNTPPRYSQLPKY